MGFCTLLHTYAYVFYFPVYPACSGKCYKEMYFWSTVVLSFGAVFSNRANVTLKNPTQPHTRNQLISMFVLSSSQPQTLQLDFLMKILPNYHHLKKTVKAGHSAS